MRQHRNQFFSLPEGPHLLGAADFGSIRAGCEESDRPVTRIDRLLVRARPIVAAFDLMNVEPGLMARRTDRVPKARGDIPGVDARVREEDAAHLPVVRT